MLGWLEKRLPMWMFSEIRFRIQNYWKNCILKEPYLFVIWLGTELRHGDEYRKVLNMWELDITIINLGFKVSFCGNPPRGEFGFLGRLGSFEMKKVL
jgi:hypothetical protein